MTKFELLRLLRESQRTTCWYSNSFSNLISCRVTLIQAIIICLGPLKIRIPYSYQPISCAIESMLNIVTFRQCTGFVFEVMQVFSKNYMHFMLLYQ